MARRCLRRGCWASSCKIMSGQAGLERSGAKKEAMEEKKEGNPSSIQVLVGCYEASKEAIEEKKEESPSSMQVLVGC